MLTCVEEPNMAAEGEGPWLLLAELNHRVRNELQVALSALRLARRGLGSEAPVRFIDDAMIRIEGLGSVHHLLDRQIGQVPLAQRLEALCRATSLSKAAPRGIQLVLKLDDVSTDEETAWTICVVACELMTNAFKHAFPGRMSGMVGVALKQDGDDVLLTVADNGVGQGAAPRPLARDWDASGFGAGIVTQLAERLDGEVTHIFGPKGAIATFRAPSSRNAPPAWTGLAPRRPD